MLANNVFRGSFYFFVGLFQVWLYRNRMHDPLVLIIGLAAFALAAARLALAYEERGR
jgi:hypothetical protein